MMMKINNRTDMTDMTDNNNLVDVFTKSPDEIRIMLPMLLDKYVKFSNGCKIDLHSNNGFFFGTTPYGVDVFFDVKDNWVECVINWLDSWNASRDETGMLLEACA